MTVDPPLDSHLCRQYFPAALAVSGVRCRLDLQLDGRWEFNARVKGRVTDEHGAPVPGMKIRIRRHRAAGSQTIEATTDKRGEYVADGLAAMTIKGGNRSPEEIPRFYVAYYIGSSVFQTTWGRTKQFDMQVRLKHAHTLKGTVRDEAGRPVKDARVHTYSWDGTWKT